VPTGRRADVALVERGVVRSRALARRLIEEGAVDLIDGPRIAPLARPSQIVHDDQTLTVRPSAESRFVSRAGAKLEGALAAAAVSVEGFAVLDVGMSTGGFTDCLLRAGATRVVGIEVGHGQLAEALAGDHRVVCLEKTDIREVDRARLAACGLPADGAERIVVDVSFISAVGLLAHLATLAAPSARLLMLVKPQFELGPKALNSRGIVRADADLVALEARSRQAAANAGWAVSHWFAAALAGTDGNQEYFLVAQRADGTMASSSR
jgi:23S rRNA (cytidine1920-2'-O)/16S rRNA (cytidine1409-2'-O)-methyltransferase